MTEPIIITVAPNGAYRQKSDHAGIPLDASELAITARACLDAGACMIHLHVRHPDGRHLLDATAYQDATASIRKVVGMELVVQITTEAGGIYQPAEQMAVVKDTRPEAVSIALRELVPDASSEASAEVFFRWVDDNATMPQIILHSAEDVRRYVDLSARGVLGTSAHFLLYVLGRYRSGQTSTPTDLIPFLAAAELQRQWAVCAFGAQERACVVAAAALGGHARVGFENNFLLPDGTPASDNAALVDGLARAMPTWQRSLASAHWVREKFA
jgi:3-keto-5-aminohexanoate cleavage enzyme